MLRQRKAGEARKLATTGIYRYLADMNPTVEAAWIALGGAVTGVGGAVLVAIAGYRNTRKATIAAIEAAHNEKVWDQRSALYVELVAAVLDRQERRGFDLGIDQMTVGGYQQKQAELATIGEPDWRQLKARVVSYASPGVVDALRESSEAHDAAVRAIAYFRDRRTRTDAHAYDGEHDAARADERSAFRLAKEAAASAVQRDDGLVGLIRSELYVWGTGLPVGRDTGPTLGTNAGEQKSP